jgi:hypothetical protein
LSIPLLFFKALTDLRLARPLTILRVAQPLRGTVNFTCRQPPSPPEVTGVPSNPFLARKVIFRLLGFFDPALAFAFPFPFDPPLEDFELPLRAFFFVATAFPP